MIELIAAATRHSPSITGQLGHGLWLAFRWPLFIWLGWMIGKMFIGPIWKAITKSFK